MNYQIRVAGVTAEDRQNILAKLSNNIMLNSASLTFELFPEPDNQYDSNAVAVYIGRKYMIGYVPKNHIVQQKVKDGVKFKVHGIIVGGKDGMNYGVILNCKTNNDNENVELKILKN